MTEQAMTNALSERKAFESWLLDVHLLTATWDEQRNCYDEFPAHLAFNAWQAAKQHAFEAPAPATSVVRWQGMDTAPTNEQHVLLASKEESSEAFWDAGYGWCIAQDTPWPYSEPLLWAELPDQGLRAQTLPVHGEG